MLDRELNHSPDMTNANKNCRCFPFILLLCNSWLCTDYNDSHRRYSRSASGVAPVNTYTCAKLYAASHANKLSCRNTSVFQIQLYAHTHPCLFCHLQNTLIVLHRMRIKPKLVERSCKIILHLSSSPPPVCFVRTASQLSILSEECHCLESSAHRSMEPEASLT